MYLYEWNLDVNWVLCESTLGLLAVEREDCIVDKLNTLDEMRLAI